MNSWQFIMERIEAEESVVLLYVLESTGSSPGRQGFKMVLAASGKMQGSIGGGIMEHKLVEKAKDMLAKKENAPFFKRQIHRKSAKKDQSGMICSGEQTVVLIPIGAQEKFAVRQIIQLLEKENQGQLKISDKGLEVFEKKEQNTPYKYQYTDDQNWVYSELIGFKPTIHIVGGGHVGRACCQQFAQLGFQVINYDDRPDLNTMTDHSFPSEKRVVNYQNIGEFIQEGPYQYVAIMSFGYRSDEVVIRQLLGKKFKYIGMMGSKKKIEKLIQTLLEDGIPKEQLAEVHMPIGIPIHSKTPEEIAVSVAAQIIAIKNRP